MLRKELAKGKRGKASMPLPPDRSELRGEVHVRTILETKQLRTRIPDEIQRHGKREARARDVNEGGLNLLKAEKYAIRKLVKFAVWPKSKPVPLRS